MPPRLYTRASALPRPDPRTDAPAPLHSRALTPALMPPRLYTRASALPRLYTRASALPRPDPRTDAPAPLHSRALTPALMPPRLYTRASALPRPDPRTDAPAPLHSRASTPALPVPHCQSRASAPAPLHSRASTPALPVPRLYTRASTPAPLHSRADTPALPPPHLLKHAQARQYNYVHAWVCSRTHKPFNTTARSGSPTAWASRTLRPCMGMLTHVIGFGSRRRVGMSAQARHRVRLTPTRRHVGSSTSSGSAHADASACQGIPAYSQARPRGSGSRPEPYTPDAWVCLCVGVETPCLHDDYGCRLFTEPQFLQQ